MKILSKIIIFIQVVLIIFTLTSTTQINTFASSSINSGNRKIENVAVLLYSFNDPFTSQVKQDLEDIQEKHKDKVKFNFYDGKYNIAVQMETLDSLLKRDNVDLFILNLADTKETTVEDIIFRIKQKNVPVILTHIPLEIVPKVSKYYDKVAFQYSASGSGQEGILEGEILVDQWNTNKDVIDKNGDNILQYVLLEGQLTNPGAVERTKDVISTLNKSGIKTEELELIHANWIKELAKDSMENLFLKYDGKIEAIISNNDAMAIGAIEALQKYGYNTGDKSKYISVVGIDGLPEAIELINKGLMTGTVIQDQKVIAEAYYDIGMNLINNVSPIENTNYKLTNGSIIVPIIYHKYTGKTNAS